MITNFAKFARTNKSIIIFSNTANHIDVFKKFFNTRVKPNEFGYIKINKSSICLLHEDLECDLITGKTTQEIRDKLLENLKEGARYILSTSKFIIFPKKFGFKRVANRLFTDYIIQGAGEISFSQVGNDVIIQCFGEAKPLNIKARAIDALIIHDELTALEES